MKEALIFLAGLGVGAVGAIFVTKKHYERIADAEIEDMRQYYESMLDEEEYEEEEPAEVVEERPVLLREKPPLSTFAKRYAEVRRPYINEAEFEHPVDSDEDEDLDYDDMDDGGIGERNPKALPVQITIDEYGELPNFDTVELMYYTGNDTLIDSEDGHVVDDRDLITGGIVTLDSESYGSLFIRNFRLGTDYHILAVDDSYEP